MFNVDIDRVEECSFSFNTICSSDWPKLWRLTTLCAPLGKSGLISPENASYGSKRERERRTSVACTTHVLLASLLPSTNHSCTPPQRATTLFGGGSFLPCRGRMLQHPRAIFRSIFRDRRRQPKERTNDRPWALTQHSSLFDVY